MTKLELWRFKLQLALSLAVFIWQLVLITVPHKAFVFGAVTLVVVSLPLLVLILRPEKVAIAPLVKHTPPPPHAELYEKHQLSQTAAQQQLDDWLAIEQRQPTHRDVLINIALLHQALGNEEQFALYWEKAKKNDPNHEVFK